MKAAGKVRIALILLVAFACACQSPAPAPPKPQVRMTMLPNGRDPILEVFANKMTDVEFVKVESPGGIMHVDHLENGRADATLVQADIAYTAFTNGTPSNPNAHKNLRAMAVASASALHLVLAPGIDIENLQGLRSLRIGSDRPGTNTEITIRSLLPKIGIPVSTMHLEQLAAADLPLRLAKGTLDAAFVLTRYPASMVQNAIAVEGAHVASLTPGEIRQLRELYPFFRPVAIPAGTYGQPEEISTVGINMVFVCRQDLSEEIVYRMLNALFASLPELAARQPGYRGVTMDQAPATPIPLHAGAARFYRERQLFR